MCTTSSNQPRYKARRGAELPKPTPHLEEFFPVVLAGVRQEAIAQVPWTIHRGHSYQCPHCLLDFIAVQLKMNWSRDLALKRTRERTPKALERLRQAARDIENLRGELSSLAYPFDKSDLFLLRERLQVAAMISRLFGFIVRVKGLTAHSLKELFSQQFVSEFARWAVNQRKISGRGVTLWLGTIRALKIYPSLKGHDFSWMLDLIQELPNDSVERAKERKERKWLSYDVLDKIPEQITRNSGPTDRDRTLAFRNALLIRWLLILPWRQRNIRECRVIPFSEGGNLFKEEIPPNSTMARAPWVDDKLRANPNERFWQFYFRPQETKNGKAVRAIPLSN